MNWYCKSHALKSQSIIIWHIQIWHAMGQNLTALTRYCSLWVWTLSVVILTLLCWPTVLDIIIIIYLQRTQIHHITCMRNNY